MKLGLKQAQFNLFIMSMPMPFVRYIEFVCLFFFYYSTLKEKRLSSFIESALVESVTEEKPDVLKALLRMWQVM